MDKEFRFNPDELSNELAAQLNVDRWRNNVKKDALTAPWSYVFDKVEPSEAITPVLRRLIFATQGSIAPDFLYAQVLTAWTYGFASALQGLASEDFTLFGGQPLGITYDETAEDRMREHATTMFNLLSKLREVAKLYDDKWIEPWTALWKGVDALIEDVNAPER